MNAEHSSVHGGGLRWLLRVAAASLLSVALGGLAAPSTASAAAVEATFNAGVLVVTGTRSANDIVVGAVARTGALRVTNHGRAVPIVAVSGAATKGALSLVVVSAGAGADEVVLAPSLGTHTAGVLLGYDGPDILQSSAGNAVLDGGEGNDVIRSGRGNDHLKGGDGNDKLIWVQGASNDHVNGGAGTDTLVIGGGAQAERFTLGKSRRVADGARFARTNLVPFFLEVCDTEVVSLFANSGNDRLTISSLTGTGVNLVEFAGGPGHDVAAAGDGSVRVRLSGGDGNDTLTGGSFPDSVLGGFGNDVMLGGSGHDLLDGGPHVDTLNGGVGPDDLNGGGGNDTLNGGGIDGATDQLTGGAGADRFSRFRGESDVFTDFNTAQGDTFI